ncbi:MAG: alcohol dehydrogenase catalytic domain-containing protein, partial [Burkholderiales bacterium]
MRGLWLEAQALRLRDDIPVPVPPEGEALVRVRLAGICNTDLELVRGYYPYAGVPGHEFVGTVERAAGAPEWVGRRVAGEINAACGACAPCQAGRRTHCDKRTVLGIVARDGAFASYLLLPVRNLHLVPDGLPDEAAVFTEPTAAALEVQQQVSVSPTDRVVVIGAGKLGHLVAQTLAVTGCRLL